jgi:crotonobetainyl-CoA:carnitine CoA-transferase CaiB-like acyl-CoA transferase
MDATISADALAGLTASVGDPDYRPGQRHLPVAINFAVAAVVGSRPKIGKAPVRLGQNKETGRGRSCERWTYLEVLGGTPLATVVNVCLGA